MRIVIFGVGKFYQEKKEELLSYTGDVIVALIDNNRQLQGNYIDGILVYAVEKIKNLNFDIIVLMSVRNLEMKKQLLQLNIGVEKIWTWEKFRGQKLHGSFSFYCGNPEMNMEKGKILIITTELNYNGGTLAAVYAGKELQRRGYGVILAAPGGNNIFIREMQKEGINIMICRALPCLFLEELAFIKQFDVILVNVFQMISCANKISQFKPVIWWVHEPRIFYESAIEQFAEYTTGDWMNNLQIYAVSKIAQKNFNYYFPNKIKNILNYGIPDINEYTKRNKKTIKKMIFAVIGSVTAVKGQDIFLEAVKKINNNHKSYSSFWIIGKVVDDLYCKDIKKLAAEEPSVKMLGEMTRKAIQNVYKKIDVLICPSREDMLPMVVTEAMMYGKVCIVSDSTGMADYIVNGKNGFVCKTGDVEDLAKKIEWLFYNKKKIQQIGNNARLVYEKHFTMDCFGNRLEKIINEINKCKKC